MKKNALILTLLFCSTITFGQEYKEINLIDLDITWGKEIFRFPARNMNYEGVGEVRFPPKGWRTPEHLFFWSYTYAWSINLNTKISEKGLALDIVRYFNSLNKVDMNAIEDKRIASAKITKIKENKSTIFFKGDVKTYDRFATNKKITLNVLVESHFCKKQQKTILLFKFSPKKFENEVWKTLKKIKLLDKNCNH